MDVIDKKKKTTQTKQVWIACVSTFECGRNGECEPTHELQQFNVRFDTRDQAMRHLFAFLSDEFCTKRDREMLDAEYLPLAGKDDMEKRLDLIVEFLMDTKERRVLWQTTQIGV